MIAIFGITALSVRTEEYFALGLPPLAGMAGHSAGKYGEQYVGNDCSGAVSENNHGTSVCTYPMDSAIVDIS